VQENAAVKKLPLFPLMVFSYGAGGSGFEYTALIEDLVSRGYVVATIEHPQSAFAVVFPDGRLVPYHVDSPPPGLSQQEQWQRFMRLASVGIEEGAADVRFVLNMLSEMSQGDAKRFPLAGKLDMSRVAVMGHSAGAESAARACDLDSRIKACIDLDGGMVPVAALPESGDGAVPLQPLLFLEAYHPESKMFGTHEQHEAYLRKREEQLQSCPKGTFAVVLKSPGMVHGSFDDTPLLEAGGHPQETAQALHNLQLSQAYIRAFLDKTLNHQDRTLLDEDVPEASVVRYPH
jgi:dienelactone hydrolase